jgi:ubiquinone biosynthesis protein COQ9
MSEPATWAEETEARLLDAMLVHAPRRGWTGLALNAAARDIGLSEGEAELLAPNGPRDLAALMARRHDALALERLSLIDPTSVKIRERIRMGVLVRCDAAMDDEPATRRWIGFLLLPRNAPLALRLAWASADVVWRWAGDVATDENHYSKRALLAEILVSTLAVRLATGAADAATHLDARIEGVMAFERWKAGVKPSELFTRLAGRLGRLRYGSA